MENEQIQEFCQEGLKISELKGVQNGLSFLIGEKFRRTFLQLKKAREKLQFLYPSEDESENHPLNKGGRALKMSYALAIQEHYSTPLEQVKHFELFLKTFAVAIKNSFSKDDIKNYFESSPTLGTYDEDRSDSELDYTGVLLEAEEILTLEEMRKLFI
ncbi:MAG: hypothetical protein CMH74_05750 [Nitrospina sp.]|jgi:hypothetical protein|nr:hypothetical protein [Nitrospina sp.]MDC0205920.1 hypothetical protein [Nitrospinota bacterium]